MNRKLQHLVDQDDLQASGRGFLSLQIVKRGVNVSVEIVLAHLSLSILTTNPNSSSILLLHLRCIRSLRIRPCSMTMPLPSLGRAGVGRT